MKGKILVSGGAGYIGRCTVAALEKEGYETVVLDDFSTGHRSMVKDLKVIEVDLRDLESTRFALAGWGRFDAVIHFAARATVSESCAQPGKYFRDNLGAITNLAELALEFGYRHFVHSSSCAIYGLPQTVPIPESSPLQPISPYGESKWMAERILKQFKIHKGLSFLNLRYFNPAGAMEDGKLGECHVPELHLIPCLVRAGLADKPFSLFGDDYETDDGTCIRDFIHVEDLAYAHVRAIEYLQKRQDTSVEALNIGLGRGFSVREVVATAEKVLGKKIKVSIAPRRPGDPPRLVAQTTQAQQLLNWKPRRSLEEMVADHRTWEVSYRKQHETSAPK